LHVEIVDRGLVEGHAHALHVLRHFAALARAVLRRTDPVEIERRAPVRAAGEPVPVEEEAGTDGATIPPRSPIEAITRDSQRFVRA
jgi:hypothetical protein